MCSTHATQHRRGLELTPIKPRRSADAVMERSEGGEKFCLACNDWRPESDFSVKRRMADGLHTRCKRCMRRVIREQTYGLRHEEFELIFARQGYACAICKTPEPGSGKDWHVDHDHACCAGTRACGKCVRGLLCGQCNVGLGLLGDNAERLQSAVDYLKRGRA